MKAVQFRTRGRRFKNVYEDARPGTSSPNRRLRSTESLTERSKEPGFRRTWNGHRTRRDAINAGIQTPTLTTERG